MPSKPSFSHLKGAVFPTCLCHSSFHCHVCLIARRKGLFPCRKPLHPQQFYRVFILFLTAKLGISFELASLFGKKSMHSAHRKAYHEPAVISVTQPERYTFYTRALWRLSRLKEKAVSGGRATCLNGGNGAFGRKKKHR